ncbi:alpha/beta hydrolase [Solihabitans fulvus]|uniref:Alpha/beta hydrolase n=1 Tax=Solihabitans fulvus TaxID=1892852 RepID=A0A5B2W753_9PSEU|nr:alpha/beta hydrolase fold domain-containing protein [Solihabitans fulvus]KAA2247671.1 alpha/beta hydrolase [Solihabitans fulvus]
MIENATGFLLTTAEAQHNIKVYLGDNQSAGDRPPASPLLADSHAGLAPAVIGCGECDPLRDEGLAYADALTAAGVPVRKHVFPGLIHGFINFDTKSAAVNAAVTTMFTELGEFLNGA